MFQLKVLSMKDDERTQWFVMRDLKRRNAKLPAFKLLQDLGMEVFVPMMWQVTLRKGIKVREEVPFLQDLLFVHNSRLTLDPIVERNETLQYRWLRNTYRQPMTVSDFEMERFMTAVRCSDSPKYYLPEGITPQMYGRKIRIVGGPLDGYEGCLLKMRGSKVKRLLVELKGHLTLGVEVQPEYIQFI